MNDAFRFAMRMYGEEGSNRIGGAHAGTFKPRRIPNDLLEAIA